MTRSSSVSLARRTPMTFGFLSDSRALSPQRRMLGALVALLVSLTSACSTGSNPFGGGAGGGNDGSGMLIRGTVLDSNGDEVFETVIRVTAYLYDDDVCGTTPIADPFQTTVNEEGGYSLLLEFDRDEFDACLDLEVIPPVESGFQGDQQFFFDQEMNEFDSPEPILAIDLHFVLERS